MRNLRWAAELAIDGDAARSKLGVVQLAALDEITRLDAYEQAMVRAALYTLDPPEPAGEEG